MGKISEEIKSEMQVMVEATPPTQSNLVKDLLRFQYRMLKSKIWCNNFKQPLNHVKIQSQQIISYIYGAKDKEFPQ